MLSVGIVIAAFNPRPADLHRAINSVRAQTYPHWECVIVDDGSSHPLSAEDVSVIRQPNLGVPAARNRGIQAVTGDFIAFLDQDDYWTPDKLDLQVTFMLERHLGMSDTDFWITRGDEEISIGYEYHEGDYCRLLSTARCGLSTLMIRRDVLKHLGGFNTCFPHTSDWELQLRIARAGYKFDRLSEILAYYQLHTQNASRDYRTMYTEQIGILDLYSANESDPAVRAAVQAGRRRMRELYAHQALDAFRESRNPADFAWAMRRDPVIAFQAVLMKIAGARGRRTANASK